MNKTASKSLTNKIDFALIFSVHRANPNGDPLNGNRPRQTYDFIGEVSDVCLKRKIRNRLQDMGEAIFVQSDDNRTDMHRSLNARFEAAELSDPRVDGCAKWFDVRAFGQVFAFKGKQTRKSKKDASQSLLLEEEVVGSDPVGGDSTDAVSIGIRGPVSIQSAFSLSPITSDSLQIVKSVNLETNEKEPDKKGSDTMGMKHRVDKGVYVSYGSINTQLASKTGFSDDDAEKIKAALCSLFVNDVSSARPEGSMEVLKVVWWKHNSPLGQYSSARVHRALRELLETDKNGTFDFRELQTKLPDLEVEALEELEGDALKA